MLKRDKVSIIGLLVWAGITFNYGILMAASPDSYRGSFHSEISSANAVCCIGDTADNFSDGNIAPLWEDISSCGIVSESGGKLILNQPGCDATDGPGVKLVSAYAICGDFDLQ